MKPEPSSRFYINTYWSKYGMIAVVLQSDDSVVARKSEAQENGGGKCEFYKSLEGMHLRQIYFVLRSTVSPLEKSRHRFVGEAAAVRWSIGKFRK